MKKITLLLLVWIRTFPIFGQTTHYNFYNFSTENGLPTNEVQHIFQDSYGFLWLATNSGLVRWDGYSLKVYTHEEEDSGSISDNIVYTIYEDSRKRLWIGTIDGLNLYRRETDDFAKYRLIPQTARVPVNDIIEDRQHNLWLATSFGLCNYDAERQKATWVPIPTPGGNVLFTISVDSANDIWAGSYNHGVIRYDPKNQKTRWFSPGPKPKATGDNRINTILNTREGETWIGSEVDGLTILDSSGRLIRQYKHFCGDPQAYDNSVTALYEDKKGTVWIGVRGQVLYYKEKSSDEIKAIDYGAENNDNSKPVSIASITADNFGNTWFASLSGGLFYNNLFKNVFRNFLRNPGAVKDLRTNIITSFCESPDGKEIWLGTAGDGLLRYDTQTDAIAFPATRALRKTTVNDIKKDETGKLWIATAGSGIKIFDPATGEVGELPEYANVKAILPDGNLLWIGTHGEGLAAYDRNKKTLIDYRNNNRFPFDLHEPSWINHLFRDTRGRLWISTYSGIYLFDGKTLKRFAHSKDPASLAGNSVNMITEDPYGGIWVAGEAGLDKYDPATDKFLHYSERYGLPKTIRSVAMGDSNLLWIATIDDVRSLNVKNDSIRQYDQNNGLLGRDFNQKAILTAGGGRLYLGTLKGFNVIDPKELRPPDIASYFHFTDLTVYNKLEKPQGHNQLLQKVLDFTDTIILSQKQSFFSIGFVSMNLYAPGKTRYAYKLDGSQQEWIETQGDNRISFTNLQHGNYLLKIRYTDVNGVWRDAGKELRIIILPYWWQTLWFRILLVIAVIMAVTVVFYMRVAAIKRRNRVLKMAVTKRTQELKRANQELEGAVSALEQSNHTKDHFFSILAHDLKNPVSALSEITGFIRQNVERMDRQKLQEYLNSMHDSSSAVYELLVNLLNWSRTQSKHIEYHPASFPLQKMIRQNVRLLENQLANKHLQIHIDIDRGHRCFADYNMTDVVVRNILSNSIKFTDYNGSIAIRSAIGNDGSILLSISDTGVGMRKDQLKKLFSLDKHSIMSGTAGEKGTGLGLIISKEFLEINKGSIRVESTIGKGSTFIIGLPAGDSAVKEEEEEEESISNEAATVDFWETIPMEKLLLIKGAKILVADDNKAVRDYLKLVLEGHFEIAEAADGKQAFQKTQEWLPDIVITDVLMPEMNGRQLCKKIKSTTETSHIPVVLLTSQSEEKVQAAGYEAGADLYLTKPIKKEILIQVCINLIQSAGVRQETLLNQILTDMPGKGRGTGLTRADEEFVGRLVAVIEKHMANQELDSRLVCKELGVSRTILYGKIKTLSGQTVHEFIKSIRLRKSLKLLLEQKMNISQIAFEVGFNSSSYYHRCFLKEYGMSPKEYINRKKKFYSITN
jgi:ligand-binding sensor domain-containing protein/signal transduction histidine kinase/CheY-like chemotaxis protein